MTQQEHEILKDRVKQANILRGRIEAWKKKVVEWTRIVDMYTNPEAKQVAEKKLIETIDQLNVLKQQYKEL